VPTSHVIPLSPPPHIVRRRRSLDLGSAERLRIVTWADPVADPHGVHPCGRYVELYWLPVIGPSTTWLLRRLFYGLEVHGDGFDLHLAETARALGLGDRIGRNAPFRRALSRLCIYDLARAQGSDELAVRTAVPPLPLRHARRLPDSRANRVGVSGPTVTCCAGWCPPPCRAGSSRSTRSPPYCRRGRW